MLISYTCGTLRRWRNVAEVTSRYLNCARATTPTQFNRIMERVKRINQKAWSISINGQRKLGLKLISTRECCY